MNKKASSRVLTIGAIITVSVLLFQYFPKSDQPGGRITQNMLEDQIDLSREPEATSIGTENRSNQDLSYYEDQIDSILSTAYPSSQEYSTHLAELGQLAIPVLGRRLNDPSQKYPVIYVRALGEMDSSEAVFPLLEFLNSKSSSTDPLDLKYIIDAIKQTRAGSAENALLELLDLPNLDIDSQIAAMSALATLGSDSTSEAMESLLIELYQNKESYYSEHDYYFVQRLVVALAEFDSPETLSIVSEVLRSDPSSNFNKDIVDSLADNGSENALEFLFNFSTQEVNQIDPTVQLYSLEKLLETQYLTYNANSPDEVIDRLEDISINTELRSFTGATPEEVLALARSQF